jgi:hypothetical protein
MNLLPVTLDTIATLYMSTLTMADLGDKLKEEIKTFCEEYVSMSKHYKKANSTGGSSTKQISS